MNMKATKPQVVFRCDGNAQIGMGHVYRCLALAEMIYGEFNCSLVTTYLPEGLKLKTDIFFREVSILPSFESHKKDFLGYLSGTEIVVLDNYYFDGEYQKKIKDLGCKILCVDDMADRHFFADAVINHTGGIKESDFEKEAYTRLFLGPEFAILRSTFYKMPHKKFTYDETPKVFICFGGSDSENFTLAALKKCLQFQFMAVNIVIGSQFQHREQIENYISDKNLSDVQIFQDIQEDELIQVMGDCQIGICPPSTVSFEAMCSGMALYLLPTADNQQKNYQYLISNHLAFAYDDLGAIKISEPMLQEIVQRQRTYFDGKQPERIRSVFKFMAYGY